MMSSKGYYKKENLMRSDTVLPKEGFTPDIRDLRGKSWKCRLGWHEEVHHPIQGDLCIVYCVNCGKLLWQHTTERVSVVSRQ